ncbi:MAG TPA: response regulator [Vicinamibacteria bacterium]|nr:response regulator [Vicinamibacteria bacterium]
MSLAVPGLDQVNVLLVDDRPDKLMALEAILADLGPRVRTARSGAEALRYLLGNDVAVILLDVNMPQMDGFETATLIRERQRSATTPIIFLTALGEMDTYAARGYSLGAVDYIHMPVRPEVLKSKVSVFVDLFLKSEQVRLQAQWLREVQEREHAARLAEATDRLDFETRRNRFFTLAVDMLGVASLDGRLRQLNPSWESTLGFSDAELQREPIWNFLHPEDRDAMVAAFRGLLEGAPTARFENRHLHRDGTYRWLSWTATPFREEGLVYVFAHDVTWRKTAEEERLLLAREQEARRVAQRENALKDQFLATLSHELRAPLTPIVGWTAMLRSGRLDATGMARGLNVIDRNVKLQAQLIEDLLDVSRIVSGKLRVDLRPTEVKPVVEAGLDSARAIAAEKVIQLSFTAPAEPLHVLGDPERLRQVVSNLASNAVKFTPEGGRVDVRLEARDRSVCVSVADTGIGISEAFLPHVFERFRQADGDTTRAHGGLGLGLAIVHHIVQAHGGTARAESAGVGQGARFEITLPARHGPVVSPFAALPTSEHGPPVVAPAALDGLTLLVVDDDKEIRELLRVALEARGAAVLLAASVAEAHAALGRVRPDVIVCDIGMPGTDGYAFVERLRSRSGGAESIPAVALTAYASRDDVVRALRAGFQVHFAKPVDPDALAHAIAALARQA